MTEYEITRIYLIIGFLTVILILIIQSDSAKRLRKKIFKDSGEAFNHTSALINLAKFAKIALLSTDAKGFIIAVNEEAVKCFGWSEKELTGSPITMLFPERHRHSISKIKMGDKSLMTGPVEIEVFSKPGDIIPIEMEVSEYKNDDITNTWYVFSIKDISHRRKNEETKRHLQSVINQDKELYLQGEELGCFGIWKLDVTTRMVERTKGFNVLFGIQRDQELPLVNEILTRVYIDDKKLVSEAVATAIEKGEGYKNLIYRVVGVDGWINTVTSTTKALKDEKGKFTHLIGITQLIKKEKPMWL